jgi:hypothetical protein
VTGCGGDGGAVPCSRKARIESAKVEDGLIAGGE